MDDCRKRQGAADFANGREVICLGGFVAGHALAWELVQTFLGARFSGAERDCRRLVKIADLERRR